MASQQVNRRLIAMVVVTALLQTALLCAAVLGPGGMEASRPRLETELEASRPRLETELEASRPRLETRPDSDAASGL